MNIERFYSLLRQSKRYEMQGSVLTISDYYTGESVSLDLSMLTEEMLEELICEDGPQEEDCEWSDIY